MKQKNIVNQIKEYQSLGECIDYLKNDANLNQLYAFTTKGSRILYTAELKENDALLFGPETRGLPDDVLNSLSSDNKLRIPMRAESRSLNLSNSVAIAAFEALRQIQFGQLLVGISKG